MTKTTFKSHGSLFEQVFAHLKGEIEKGTYEVGAKMPTIQALSADLSVSPLTVHKAFQLLSDEGLVRSHVGKRGTVVRSKSSRPMSKAQLVGEILRPVNERNQNDNFRLDMVEAIHDEMVCNDLFLASYDGSKDESVGQLMSVLADNRLTGIIYDDKFADKLAPLLKKCDLPMIVINCLVDNPGVFNVIPDYEVIGRGTAERFVKAGYKRFHCQWTYPEDRIAEGRKSYRRYHIRVVIDSFASRIRELTGKKCRFIDYPPSELFDKLIQSSMTKPESCFLCLSDRLLARARRVLHQSGVPPESRSGIAGVFDMAVNRDVLIPVSSWRVDPAELGRTAVRVLKRILSGETPPKTTLVKPEWVDRGTV